MSSHYSVEGELSRTDSGAAVVRLRDLLVRAGLDMPYLSASTVDRPEYFDDHVDAAVRAFQQSRGLIVDGVAGRETLAALYEAQYHLGERTMSYQPNTTPIRGDDVSELQRHLSHLGFYYGHIDGVFGYRTMLSVKELQRSLGLTVDGSVDSETLKAMERVSRSLTSSKAFALRDYERLNRASRALRHRIIALSLDVHGNYTDVDGERLTDEAILSDVAARLRETLMTLNARTVELDMATGKPLESNQDASIVGVIPNLRINLNVDWLHHRKASGMATYYWGSTNGIEVHSPVGERGADLIQRELVARTSFVDLGHHARNWDSLRMPRVPCVSVDLGYLSNVRDAAHLADPEMRQRISDAIVIGIQRLFLLEDDDEPTGSLRVSDVFRFNGIS